MGTRAPAPQEHAWQHVETSPSVHESLPRVPSTRARSSPLLRRPLRPGSRTPPCRGAGTPESGSGAPPLPCCGRAPPPAAAGAPPPARAARRAALPQSGRPHATERSSSGGLRPGAAGAGGCWRRPRGVPPGRRGSGSRRPRRGWQRRGGQVASGAPGLPRGLRGRRRRGQAGAPGARLPAARALPGRAPRAASRHPGSLQAAAGARLRRPLLRRVVRLRRARRPRRRRPRPYAAPAPWLAPSPPYSGRDPRAPGAPCG